MSIQQGNQGNILLPNGSSIGFNEFNQVCARAVALDGVAGTNPYVPAAAQSVALPANVKAVGGSLLRAWARAGTGTKGLLVVDAAESNAAPAAGHVAVAPNGDLLTAAADAWTSIDVIYLPENQTIHEFVAVCVPGTGLVTLPAGIAASKLVSILEAEILVGGVQAKTIVAIPADAAPTTGLCRLTLDKTAIHFCVADAATSVRLKVDVVPQ